MADKMLWNKDKDRSVKTSKVRNFSIARTPMMSSELEMSSVYGWYNANEYFYFGEFNSIEAAREFLQGLHDYIES